MCDTEMSPANFRGAESRRKDILLEFSVDFLARLGLDPADLPVAADRCSLTRRLWVLQPMEEPFRQQFHPQKGEQQPPESLGRERDHQLRSEVPPSPPPASRRRPSGLRDPPRWGIHQKSSQEISPEMVLTGRRAQSVPPRSPAPLRSLSTRLQPTPCHPPPRQLGSRVPLVGNRIEQRPALAGRGMAEPPHPRSPGEGESTAPGLQELEMSLSPLQPHPTSRSGLAPRPPKPPAPVGQFGTRTDL